MSESMKNREISPNSLKNLKRYPKGQTGNPKGKPKGTADFMSQLKTAIKEVEKEEIEL